MDTPENPPQSAAKDGRETALSEPLLDLSTLTVRPLIAIDGARHEILSPDELSILDSHRLGAWGRRIQQLAEAEGAEAEAELEQLVDKVARKVAVGVPDAVWAQLSGAHKQAIADVFTGLLLRTRLGVAGAIAKAAGIELQNGTAAEIMAATSIGAKSSPGSSGSTAGSPNGGWKTRLARWFGRS
jgi:hypothetical protein